MTIKHDLLSGTTHAATTPEPAPVTTSTVDRPDARPSLDTLKALIDDLPPPRIYLGVLHGAQVYLDPTLEAGEILFMVAGRETLRVGLDHQHIQGTRLHAVAKIALEDWRS